MEKDNQVVSVEIGAGNHVQLINEKVIGIFTDVDGYALGWVKWGEAKVLPVITWTIDSNHWYGDFRFMVRITAMKESEENLIRKESGDERG